jgi:hypothetical protein
MSKKIKAIKPRTMLQKNEQKFKTKKGVDKQNSKNNKTMKDVDEQRSKSEKTKKTKKIKLKIFI